MKEFLLFSRKLHLESINIIWGNQIFHPEWLYAGIECTWESEARAWDAKGKSILRKASVREKSMPLRFTGIQCVCEGWGCHKGTVI